ncbi:MAG TPA: hypothetical protein VHO69_01530 [Phototrophicaceae bacterium]|nr:hypothetical protein [Phototrophicaceae bacterium]
MTRSLLKLASLLLMVFAVLNVTARAIGTLQPPNPVLAGFTEGCEDKPQPCWYGITSFPAELRTTEAEALHILAALGYSVEITSDFSSGIHRIVLETNHLTGSDCRVVLTTAYMWVNNDPDEQDIYVQDFALVDCEFLLLGDLLGVLNGPSVFYTCSYNGAEKIRFRDWWLNINQFSPSSHKMVDPVWVDDRIDNISSSLGSPINNWQFDHSSYRLMPRWKLHQELGEKYCKYG